MKKKHASNAQGANGSTQAAPAPLAEVSAESAAPEPAAEVDASEFATGAEAAVLPGPTDAALIEELGPSGAEPVLEPLPAEGEAGPGAALADRELENAVLALLFASPEMLSAQRLAQLLQGAPTARVRAAIDALRARLEAAELPLEIRELAGGYRVLSAVAQAETVARLARARKAEKISSAALETLSIVAYRQPVTKAEIEAIRGVQAGPVLRALVDRRLVRVSGRAEQPGSPLQYATTREFLDQFGLGSLKDLPRDTELVKE